MSVTKHKFFKIDITDKSNLTFSKTIESSINNFLIDPNIVYVNHSITTLTEDIEEYDTVKTTPKTILLSIIYKDLNDSPLNLNKTSTKTRKIVRKEIELNSAILEPEILTELDKNILNLNKK